MGSQVYSAGQQITRALRLLGVLADGETPSAQMAEDSLMALNQMISSWSIDRLSTFVTEDQTFVWPAGFIERTIGPTGDFVGHRPVYLDDSTYYVRHSTGEGGNISYNISIVNEEQYNGVSLKRATSTLPMILWINMGYPNAYIHIYPQPTEDIEFHFISARELDKPAGWTTKMLYPPGYLRAFTYNLAIEIAPEFGVDPPSQVVKIAVDSHRSLKRMNNPDDVMATPSTLIYKNQRFNIYTGIY